MKLKYKGKYSGDESTLPQREHPEGYVPFREPEHKKFAVIANVGAIILLIILFIIMIVRAGEHYTPGSSAVLIGMIIALLTMFPHEILHASCFKEEVWLFTNLSKGMLFVVGPEDMTKGRFIFMSLLPNIVFGFIPFIVFLFVPKLIILGTMGAMCISMGFGDYFNVFNALTQMPKGALTYLSGFHSYWYIPKN
jgi:hypothetical protein